LAQPSTTAPKRRATRKPLLYAELRRWYQPGLRGLAADEIRYLELLGYGRWLQRGRLTAEMVVVLIDDALLYLEEIAEDQISHPAAERRRMILVLLAMTATSHREDEDALRLLDALVRLDEHVTRTGGTRYISGDGGTWKAAREPRPIAQVWRAIQRRYPNLITWVRNQVVNEHSSERTLALGNGRTIILGEQPRHDQLRRQLRAELGPRYLAANATLEYRCARVRKWKEQAMARETLR
jgi:hypothetical protein